MATSKELQELNNSNFSGTPVASAQAISALKTIDPNSQGISTRDTGRSNLFRDMAGDYAYEGQNKSVASPFASDYFNSKMWGFDLGEVTNRHKDIYGGVNPYSKAVDFEQLRRNEQSNFSAGVNLFNQFVGKTAVNAIGGIVGGFYGLGASIVNQDASLLFDNSVNRTLDKGTDWLEENNSVFTSQASRNQLGFFSFETVKDFTDAYSFISGAVASELILASATGGLGLAGIGGRIARGTNFLNRTANRVAKSVGLGNGLRTSGTFIDKSEELARLLTSIDPTDVNRLQQLARQTGTSVENLQRYRRSIDGFNNTIRKGRQIVTGTFWEAGLEARHTKDELTNSELSKLEDFLSQNTTMSNEEKEQYRAEETKRIEDVANTAGIWTFGLNTAVLGVSNHIQFPSIFGRQALSRANNMAGRINRQGLANYVRSGGKYSDILKTVGRALKSPATEFTEETLQGAINIGSKSYYESMLGTRTSSGEITPVVSNLSDAVIKGLKETYGTKEGIHEGIIGALVGAIGVPMLRKNKRGKLRSVQMSGGIFEAIRNNRQENNNIRDSIEQLNLNEFDTLLSYNKDNAILSSIDAHKETIAELKEDKFEIERLNDNKIYRHVRDRLDKGLESYMNSDIQEIQNMTLEEYKTRFNKPESFTQEEKTKEANAFAEKAQIYSDAYKKVYEGLQMDRINNNSASKKLFDTLTYAVANEKIYSKRQRELTDKLLSNPNIDLNYQELTKLAELSDKFQAYEDSIKEYIKSKEDAKLETFNKKKSTIDRRISEIKDRVSPERQNILNDVLNEDANTADYLRKIISLQDELSSQTYKDLASESEIILESVKELQTIIEEAKLLDISKDRVTKFSPNKSSVVRNMRRKSPEILSEIKTDIEKNSSKSLEILRNKKESATQQEIEEYINLRERANEAITNANRNNIGSFLDNISTDNDQDIKSQLDELANITKHQILALDIATNLYGIGKVQNAFGKIVTADFEENLSNLQNDIALSIQSLIRQDDENYMAELLANITQSIKNIKEALEEYNDILTEEAKERIISEIEKAEDVESALKKYLDLQDTKEEVEEDTKKQDKKEAEEKQIESVTLKERLNEAEEKQVEEELKSRINTLEFDNSRVSLFNSKNLHTITPKNSTNANSIKEKIDNGTIKYNSGVIASYLETNEDTDSFKEYLRNLNLEDSYNRGKAKVQSNIELLAVNLEELDADVKVFITHSPINVNIYDKEVDIVEGVQELNIDDDTAIVHDFLYFAPQLDNIDNSKIEDYNNKKEKLDSTFKEEVNKLNELLNTNITKQQVTNKLDSLYNTLISNGNTETDAERLALESLTEEERNILRSKNTNNTTAISNEEYNKRKAVLQELYQRDLNDLQNIATIAVNNLNDKVLFNFRQSLLINNYSGLNELKMRLGNIINGYIEKLGDNTFEVDEFGITSANGNDNYLVEDINSLGAEDILFGNQRGEYIDFNGNQVKLNRGSNVNKTNALNSKIYLRYKTINNQEIPVILNRSKLGNSPIIYDEIVTQLEKYFEEGKNPNNLITLKNTQLTFLRGLSFKDFFSTFIDTANSSTTDINIPTLNINKITNDIYLGNLNLAIDSVETFNENKASITNALSEMRYYMNKASFRNSDASFNKEFLKFVLENNLINHAFNTKDNIDKIFRVNNSAGEAFNKAIQFHILNSETKRSIPVENQPVTSEEQPPVVSNNSNNLQEEIDNFLNKINAKEKIEPKIETTEPDVIGNPIEFSMSEELARMASPGDFNEDVDESNFSDFIIDNLDEEDTIEEVIITPLSREDETAIKINKSIIKSRISRLEGKLNNKTISKEKIQDSFKEYNINSYENFVDMINILYNDNSTELNKFVTFANKVYDRTDNNFNC